MSGGRVRGVTAPRSDRALVRAPISRVSPDAGVLREVMFSGGDTPPDPPTRTGGRMSEAVWGQCDNLPSQTLPAHNSRGPNRVSNGWLHEIGAQAVVELVACH